MDPKSKLASVELPSLTIVKYIDDYASTHTFHWNVTPEELKQQILNKSNLDMKITYLELHNILENVYTPKLSGFANRGLKFFDLFARKLAKDIISSHK